MESSDSGVLLFPKTDVPIDKFVLQGEFETLHPGQFIIEITNQKHNPLSIWYQIKQTDLPVCHLFEGIVNLFYTDDLDQRELIKIRNFSDKLDNAVFPFVDQLLDGKKTLTEMTDLENIFRGENIHIPYEVEKLLINRSKKGEQQSRITYNEQEIKGICESLQIFQYYSHIEVIINCIKTFAIISDTNGNEIIANLEQQLSSKKECILKNISGEYRILTQEFQDIKSKHLDLIKTANECRVIVGLMKEFDLYSTQGRQKFQALRDNLTIQFQLQERNNMILNSFIIAYALCEPFVLKANTLQEFVSRIVNLSNFDSNSLKNMKGKIIFSIAFHQFILYELLL
ncbi:unnamed protein product [Rotaria sp. Silwood1]|nr:unnamed protein product [Rotaria sp. Silwood1]CAF1502724.1 unnamed protein product [Rotaria sp. Silwood1]CAF1527598.1 unnamed protein product [Rotaria sp. Silwood1]CAF3638514.1 unnamed protein product [Rotaria sp. Silwood1]CAF4867123.1 unnamed protein product [Rotaria sp. Silwood1]